MLDSDGAAKGLKSRSSKMPGSWGNHLDALLAMSSASLLVPRGTCCTSRPRNYFSILHTSPRYASMCSSFGSYTLLEKLTRSYESPLLVRRFTPKATAALRLAINPSYSTMFLETFSPAGSRAALRSRACLGWVR